MKIAFTVNGSTNMKLKPRNMSTHLICNLMDNSEHVSKMMNVKDEVASYMEGRTVYKQEEIGVPLTNRQYSALMAEYRRRTYKRIVAASANQPWRK